MLVYFCPSLLLQNTKLQPFWQNMLFWVLGSKRGITDGTATKCWNTNFISSQTMQRNLQLLRDRDMDIVIKSQTLGIDDFGLKSPNPLSDHYLVGVKDGTEQCDWSKCYFLCQMLFFISLACMEWLDFGVMSLAQTWATVTRQWHHLTAVLGQVDGVDIANVSEQTGHTVCIDCEWQVTYYHFM